MSVSEVKAFGIAYSMAAEITTSTGRPTCRFAYHAKCGEQCGYLMKRKRLVDRAAFNYDPNLGWEKDIWFEWEKGKPT